MHIKYKKVILSISCTIMLLGMMTFSTKNSLVAREGNEKSNIVTSVAIATGNSKENSVNNKENSESSTENATSDSIENSTGNVAKGISLLMKNAYPEVNKLIMDYFVARLMVDKAAITKIVDDINYAGIDRLPKLNKHIEHIKLVDCYTIDGPEKGSVMVYAKIKLKFKGIRTSASGIDGFYVKPDKTGKLKIVLSPISDEVQKILDEDYKRDDVKTLMKAVNTELAHELQEDKKLAKFYKRLSTKKK